MSRLRQINVASRSPQEAVEVHLSPDGGLAARLGRAGVGGHSEKSFAAELEAAVARALKGYGQATRHIMTSTHGTTNRPPDETRGPGLSARAAAVEVTGASAQNLVLITRTGAGGVSVRVCPGTLRRLRDDQLVCHINAALAAASREMRRSLARALTAESPATEY